MPAVLVKRLMKLFRMTSCKLLQREEKIRVHLHLVIILTFSVDVKHHVYLFSLDRKQKSRSYLRRLTVLSSSEPRSSVK